MIGNKRLMGRWQSQAGGVLRHCWVVQPTVVSQKWQLRKGIQMSLEKELPSQNVPNGSVGYFKLKSVDAKWLYKGPAGHFVQEASQEIPGQAAPHWPLLEIGRNYQRLGTGAAMELSRDLKIPYLLLVSTPLHPMSLSFLHHLFILLFQKEKS